MDVAKSILDSKLLAIGSILLCVLFSVLLVRRVACRYERSFVDVMESSLRQNFIVADPHMLFAVSAATTLVLGSLGYGVLGPLGAVIGAALGVAAPRLTMAILIRRRMKQFVYQLPDALLALSSALRAGSNFTRGLELLATRQPAPLSQEFTIVLAEQRVGRQLSDSLADLRRRIDTPDLDLMNTAINVSRRVGGNLADALEALAKTLREKAHMEGKIDALTSMGRAQGWVVSLLPILIGLVLYQQQPERMGLLFTEWYGWIVLAVVAVMMSVAAWIIRKIVNIDV